MPLLLVFLGVGMLATPSKLIEHAPAALAIALVLMFIARPVAVGLCLWPFRFPWREQAFISWVGLRGAVPIMGPFTLLAGVGEAILILDVAFFVVRDVEAGRITRVGLRIPTHLR